MKVKVKVRKNKETKKKEKKKKSRASEEKNNKRETTQQDQEKTKKVSLKRWNQTPHAHEVDSEQEYRHHWPTTASSAALDTYSAGPI